MKCPYCGHQDHVPAGKGMSVCIECVSILQHDRRATYKEIIKNKDNRQLKRALYLVRQLTLGRGQ